MKNPEAFELDKPLSEEKMESLLVELKHSLITKGRCGDKTIIQYTRDIQMFFKWNRVHNGNKPLNEIEVLDIDSYSDYIRMGSIDENINPISTVTLSRKLAALRRLFKFLKTSKLIAYNPMPDVEAPMVFKDKIVSIVTNEEMDKILNLNLGSMNGRKNPNHPEQRSNPHLVTRNRAIFHLLAASGARVSELCGLNVKDFDPQSPSIVIHKGKGSKTRIVDITEEAAQAISAYLKIRPHVKDENALFLSERDKRISRFMIYRLCEIIKEKLGIDKPLSPHKFRHWVGSTLMQSQKMSLVNVRDHLGHKNIATTSLYLHSNDALSKLEYNKAHPRSEK